MWSKTSKPHYPYGDDSMILWGWLPSAGAWTLVRVHRKVYRDKYREIPKTGQKMLDTQPELQ